MANQSDGGQKFKTAATNQSTLHQRARPAMASGTRCAVRSKQRSRPATPAARAACAAAGSNAASSKHACEARILRMDAGILRAEAGSLRTFAAGGRRSVASRCGGDGQIGIGDA